MSKLINSFLLVLIVFVLTIKPNEKNKKFFNNYNNLELESQLSDSDDDFEDIPRLSTVSSYDLPEDF